MSLDCMSELSSSVDSSGSGAPSRQVFDSQSGEHPGYRCCSFMHDPRASIASLQVARLGGSDHLAGLTARSTTTVGDKLLDAAKSNDSRQFEEAQAVSVRHHCSCWERHGTRKRGHEPCRRLSSSLHGSEHTWLCSNCSNSSQVGAISAIWLTNVMTWHPNWTQMYMLALHGSQSLQLRIAIFTSRQGLTPTQCRGDA